MKRSGLFVIFIVYALFGLYFINSKMPFYVLSEKMLIAHSWIIFVGGVFLIFGGLKFLMSKATPTPRSRDKRR